MHAAGGVERPERHLDPVADGDVRGPGIGELALVAAAGVEVDDDVDHRRGERVGQPIDRVGLIVPASSASDTCSIVSTAPQRTQMRCGGRLTALQVSQREA
ncbi:MAG: hypothetical protein QOI98_3264, partial [Solirubrobacteraceae bacterium]|nr:hypothetical protein [Solirubrobacteraceae bacterium]